MVELLPCPFCGGKGELVHPQDDMYIVGCSNEDCPMWCGLAFNMIEHAVKFWNTRTPKFTENMRETVINKGGDVNDR